MPSVIPKEVKKEIVDAWIAETTWKVALFQAGSNILTQSLYDAVVCTLQVSGAGYTVGGATLVGRSGAYVDTDDYKLSATNTAWTGATFSNVQYIAVYETTGNKIRAVFDLTTTYSVTSGTFTIQWSGSGLIKVS